MSFEVRPKIQRDSRHIIAEEPATEVAAELEALVLEDLLSGAGGAAHDLAAVDAGGAAHDSGAGGVAHDLVAVDAGGAAPGNWLEDLVEESVGTKRAAIPKGVPFFRGAGVVGHAWQSLAARARWDKHRAAKAAAELDEAKALPAIMYASHNANVLRVGDQCGAAPSGLRTHANRYSMDGLLRSAAKGIGQCSSQKEGLVDVDGSRRSLEMLVTGSGLVGSRFRNAETAFHGSVVARGKPLFIARHFDGTPMLFKFGRLQDTLKGIARYLDLVETPHGKRWKTISYAEFCRLHPRAAKKPSFGVLELFARTLSVHVEDVSQTFIQPPCVLERTTGSCSLSAVNAGAPSFSTDAIIELAKEVEAIILDDCPDGCKANLRLKLFVGKQLPANVLYNESSFCCVHRLHNIITKAMCESALVGHIHACHFVMNIHQRREKLHSGLRQLVGSELVVFHCEPPAEYKAHTKAVIDATILRRMKLVRARAIAQEGDEEGEVLRLTRTYEAFVAAVPGLMAMFNGDIRKGRIEHYCCGCCKDAEGRFSRDVCVDNMVSAATSVGLFGDLDNTKPEKSKWLSSSGYLAMLAAGIAIHRVLPRVWNIAFPDWNIPALPQDSEDYHAMTRSKAYRAKLWLNNMDENARALMLTVVTAPLDHCMQVVQMLDHKGAALKKLVKSAESPFSICMSELVDMFCFPNDSKLKVLAIHYEHAEAEERVGIARSAYQMLLSVAARVWRELDSQFRSWPTKLGADASLELFRELYAAEPCCLDAGFSAKLRAMAVDAESLMELRDVMVVLDLWARMCRVCNMSLERLLSLIRRSAPARCHVERILCAGHMSQLRNAHWAAGGKDCTKRTRQQLLKHGVPIKACARRRTKKPQAAATGYVSFARWSSNKWKRLRLERQQRAGVLQPSQVLSDRAGYNAQIQRLAAEWKECGGAPPAPDAEEDEAVKSYADRIGTKLWGLSDEDWFCRPCVLEEALPDIAGIAEPTRAIGLTQRLGPFREAHLKSLITPHGTLIPDSAKFAQEMTCGKLHPGVCRHVLPKGAASAAVSLAKAASLHAWPVGSHLRFRASVAGGDHQWIAGILFAGHYSNAQVLLADLDDDADPRGMKFQVGEKVMMDIWEQCGGNPLQVEAQLVFTSVPEIDWLRPLSVFGMPREDLSHSFIQLWPLPHDVARTRAAPKASEEARELKTALAELQRALDGEVDTEAFLAEEDEAGVSSLEARLGSMLQARRRLGGKRLGKRVSRKRPRAKSKAGSARKKQRVSDVPAPAGPAASASLPVLAASSASAPDAAPASQRRTVHRAGPSAGKNVNRRDDLDEVYGPYSFRFLSGSGGISCICPGCGSSKDSTAAGYTEQERCEMLVWWANQCTGDIATHRPIDAKGLFRAARR